MRTAPKAINLQLDHVDPFVSFDLLPHYHLISHVFSDYLQHWTSIKPTYFMCLFCWHHFPINFDFPEEIGDIFLERVVILNVFFHASLDLLVVALDLRVKRIILAHIIDEKLPNFFWQRNFLCPLKRLRRKDVFRNFFRKLL